MILEIFSAVVAGVALPAGVTLLVDGDRLLGQICLAIFVATLVFALW